MSRLLYHIVNLINILLVVNSWRRTVQRISVANMLRCTLWWRHYFLLWVSYATDLWYLATQIKIRTLLVNLKRLVLRNHWGYATFLWRFWRFFLFRKVMLFNNLNLIWRYCGSTVWLKVVILLPPLLISFLNSLLILLYLFIFIINLLL